MAVERILRGLSSFRKNVYPRRRELFEKLSLGQRPEALFITCSDSRIDPCLLTQSKPGDLFICRVAGNIVPRYPQAIGGVSATIEYAVAVLGVEDIIVCGHTDCGVMKGVLNPEALAALPSVTAWLAQAHPARDAVIRRLGRVEGPEFLQALTGQNVADQLDNLRTHPTVAAGLAQGELRLHGWVYDIGTGNVTAYDEADRRFAPAS